MEMEMRWGCESFCICEARVWKREGKEVVVVVVSREETCLCKRENLEREVQDTKTCRHEHHQNK